MMSKNETTLRPPPKASAWADSEPTDERQARELAWQEYRCCRDCKHWYFDEEDDDGAGIGACGAPFMRGVPASFMVPEDYTCGFFEGQPDGE